MKDIIKTLNLTYLNVHIDIRSILKDLNITDSDKELLKLLFMVQSRCSYYMGLSDAIGEFNKKKNKDKLIQYDDKIDYLIEQQEAIDKALEQLLNNLNKNDTERC